MIHDNSGRGHATDPESSEDIEILEVVGVDEDGVPIVTADPDDVEVVFEESGSAEESPARPAKSAPTVEDSDLRERLIRLQADFENFKKRIERERIDHFRYATFGLVGRILPVLDNFERAMAAARSSVSGDALVEGVALIHRQLVAELAVEGLRGMESGGDRSELGLSSAHRDPRVPKGVFPPRPGFAAGDGSRSRRRFRRGRRRRRPEGALTWPRSSASIWARPIAASR
jgi:molecular chaperone GrpE